MSMETYQLHQPPRSLDISPMNEAHYLILTYGKKILNQHCTLV